ncbi:MAG: hypothetical protein JO165_12300, partial [Candidatus Eremiobacteraeota bacterium]|nr:hypothetical protein [Candidatus Eremiobacteraeota bacterium]
MQSVSRSHRQFSGYFAALAQIDSPQLVALKVEAVQVGLAMQRFVDVVVSAQNRLAAIPFIRVNGDNDPILHVFHQGIGEETARWVRDTVAGWIQRKGTTALGDVDLFTNDDELVRYLQSDAPGMRAIAGIAPYQRVFDEADRYANLLPFIASRRVRDFNPGCGYGASTLRQSADRVGVDVDALHAFAKRFTSPATDMGPVDTAIYLDVNSDANVREFIENIRARAGAEVRVILSMRGDRGRENLQSAGFTTRAMVRPGANALGPLDEWLAVVDAPARGRTNSFAADVPAAAVEVGARPLNVLFALRASAKAIFGGDVVQIRETVEALRRRGHRVEISYDNVLPAAGFDIVHLTNLTSPDATLLQAQSVQAFPGPVVLMPIFIDHADETVWGMKAEIAVYSHAADERDLQEKLGLIESRRLSIEEVQPPPARMELGANYTPMQRAILSHVDYAIANAHSEMHRLYRYLDYGIPYSIAPSCA